MFVKLAYKSLLHRKVSVLLIVLAMSVSVFVLIGVEHIRHQSKVNFNNSISNVDLIVGAPTGKLNLLLYSVFRIGVPTNNISWQSFETISNHSAVKWAVPISLGDSHKGYRVLGTTSAYFEHYKYRNGQSIILDKGSVFNHVQEVVLGAKVASDLNYQIGDNIFLSHGIGKTSFSQHDQLAFEVVGIIAPTGTPIDQTIHVSLQGIEAVHVANPQKILGNQPVAIDSLDQRTLAPKSITAAFVGLNSKMLIFQLRRAINTNDKEAMMAVLPGATLSEFWQSLAVMENTLRLISSLIVMSALLGLSAMLFTSIRERKQEIALLRMLGASSIFVFFFIQLEALMIVITSVVIATLSLYVSLTFAQDFLIAQYGLAISTNFITTNTLLSLTMVLLLSLLSALPSALKVNNTN